MKLEQSTLPAFVAALMILFGMGHADAESLKWRADLTVDYIEEDVQGISIRGCGTSYIDLVKKKNEQTI
jgi:hypothetical protein